MTSPFDLSGKTVLVTGASSGIGQRFAESAASLGAQIIAVGRETESLDDTLRRLGGDGHMRLVCDLSAREAVEALMEALPTDVAIDGFAHFAGQDYMRPLGTLSAAAMADQYAIHVVAAVSIIQRLSKRPAGPDGLAVILASSVSALRGQPGLLAYSAAKAALSGLVGTLAVELAPRMVRINMLVIGHVENTRMSDRTGRRLNSDLLERLRLKHPLGFGSVDDPAWAACFLISPAARWITGASLAVDGGFCAA